MIVGVTLPLQSRALTQYVNIPATGAAMLQGKLIVATATGLHTLDNSESDNGTAIPAWFRSIKTDFGAHNRKRIRSLFLRGLAKLLKVSLYTEAATTDMTYTSSTGDLEQEEGFMRGRRDQWGAYWQIGVANVTGEDFSVDAVDVQLVVQPKLKGGIRWT
jgi:hypothetical protein